MDKVKLKRSRCVEEHTMGLFSRTQDAVTMNVYTPFAILHAQRASELLGVPAVVIEQQIVRFVRRCDDSGPSRWRLRSRTALLRRACSATFFKVARIVRGVSAKLEPQRRFRSHVFPDAVRLMKECQIIGRERCALRATLRCPGRRVDGRKGVRGRSPLISAVVAIVVSITFIIFVSVRVWRRGWRSFRGCPRQGRRLVPRG